MATVYFTASSLDGFIADPDHSLDWLTREDRSRDDDHRLSYGSFYAQVGAVVMGRTTYDWVVGQQGSAEPVYGVPTWVVTSRDGVDMPGVRTFGGDVASLHPLLVEAAGGKHVWVVGGGDLAGQFHDAGLLDEVWVQLAPVTLGGGAPLLPRRVELRLLDGDRNLDFVDTRYAVVRP